MSYQRTTWVNGETPINADNLNNMEEGIAEIENMVPKFSAGYELMGTIQNNSYADKSVTFDPPFSDVPNVVACLSTTGTVGNIGNVSVAVNAITKTGCTIRVFNNRGSSLSPAVEWIAVEI